MASLLQPLNYAHLLRLFKVLLAFLVISTYFLLVLSSLLAIKDGFLMLQFNFSVNRRGWKKAFVTVIKKMCARSTNDI